MAVTYANLSFNNQTDIFQSKSVFFPPFIETIICKFSILSTWCGDETDFHLSG